jgi:hypothetical protein
MPRRKRREPRPAKSNRGRLDARGVFIVFEPPSVQGAAPRPAGEVDAHGTVGAGPPEPAEERAV